MSREEKNKKSNGMTKVLIVILIVIVLPLLSLGAGFLGVQFLMKDQVSEEPQQTKESSKALLNPEKSEEEPAPAKEVEPSTEEESPEETVEEPVQEGETMTYTLPSLHTFSIQVGSFGELANANKKALASL